MAAAPIFSSEDIEESTITVLDLKDYHNINTRNEFLQKLRAALHLDGFFALKNTGIDMSIINRAYASSKRFFSMDIEQKLECDGSRVNGQRGYCRAGIVQVKGEEAADCKEYFALGRGDGGPWFNMWPKCMNLQTPLEEFYRHLDEYSLIVMEIFSKALRQEKNFLATMARDGDSSARIIRYPADKSNFDKESKWLGAHTDFTLFTILPRATERGLEVQDRNGDWKPVYVSEDAYVVNCGDLIETMSNGNFLSPNHRVKKPMGVANDRYSSVLFVHPRHEAVICPLEYWVKKEGRALYAKATGYETLMEGLASISIATDEMLKQLAESKYLERLIEVARPSKEAMEAVQNAGYASATIKNKLLEMNQ